MFKHIHCEKVPSTETHYTYSWDTIVQTVYGTLYNTGRKMYFWSDRFNKGRAEKAAFKALLLSWQCETPVCASLQHTRTWDYWEGDVSSTKCLWKWATALFLSATSRPKLGTKHSPRHWPAWPADRRKALLLATWMSGTGRFKRRSVWRWRRIRGIRDRMACRRRLLSCTDLLPMVTGWDDAKRPYTQESLIKWP